MRVVTHPGLVKDWANYRLHTAFLVRAYGTSVEPYFKSHSLIFSYVSVSTRLRGMFLEFFALQSSRRRSRCSIKTAMAPLLPKSSGPWCAPWARIPPRLNFRTWSTRSTPTVRIRRQILNRNAVPFFGSDKFLIACPQRQWNHRLSWVPDHDGPEDERHRQRGGDQRGFQSLRQGTFCWVLRAGCQNIWCLAATRCACLCAWALTGLANMLSPPTKSLQNLTGVVTVAEGRATMNQFSST